MPSETASETADRDESPGARSTTHRDATPKDDAPKDAEHRETARRGTADRDARDARDGHEVRDERRKRRTERKDRRTERARRLEQRLTLPVIIAAIVSVPATFLSALTGWPGVLGKVFNWGAAAVLAGEPVLLFLLAGHRRAWLKEHLWAILIAAVAVPAVLFAAAAPYFQALRLLRLAHVMTAFRLLRINRILKSAETLRRYLLVDIFWRRLSSVVGPVIAFGFAGLVLADPEYRELLYLDDLSDRFGLVPVVLVVALLSVALLVTVRHLQRLLSWWIRGVVGHFRERIEAERAAAAARRERRAATRRSATRRRERPGSSATAG
jgi:CsoR family transcriptional regulator, copper-sensing transcriptional repressor